MNKKIISIAMVLALSCACIFASFDGRSTVGVNYSFENGTNYFGLSTDHTGYFNDVPVGYFIGADAEFGIGNLSAWRVNMLIGPSYRYYFGNTDVSFELAAGLSLGGTSAGFLGFGLGGYVGAAYDFSEHVSVLIGAKLGSNFVRVDFNNPSIGFAGDFYVTPQVALGFRY